MKGRYWWFVIGTIMLLAVAFSIDQSGLLVGKDRPGKGSSFSLSQETLNLHVCDMTQISYSGPLIPDQNTNSPDFSLADVNPDEKIPKSAWSSRVGFSISTSTNPEYWAQMLGSGWYLDWTVQASTLVDTLDHWQMIRVHEDCVYPSVEEIERVAMLYPVQVWVIGNEPDVIWQDNVTAARYAVIYHTLYKVIKTFDPSALIAVGGVSQATALRLRYLDQVLSAYQIFYHEPMPVDWWTVHGYVLREEKGSWGVDIPPGIDATRGELREVKDHGKLDLFESQLRSFRQWMAQRGYQDTPLALTEFGILMPSSYGFPTELVTSYLEETFTWLSQVQDESIGDPRDGYHLVQKWAWFSISDPTYSSSNLGDLSSGRLTLLGEKFRTVTSSLLP